MTPGVSIDPSKTDSNLLMSLSRASRALKSCTSEDIKETLLAVSRLATRPSAAHSDSDMSHRDKVDGESSHTEALLWLLQSRCQAVQYAAVKTLLALSDALKRTRALDWPSFLHHLWTAVTDWVSDPSRGCGRCQPEKLLATTNAVDLIQRVLKGCLRSSCGGANGDLRAYLKLFMENITVLITSACIKQKLSNCSQCLAGVEVHVSEDTIDPEELLLGSVLRLLCTGTNVVAPNSLFNVEDDDGMSEHFLGLMEVVIPALSSAVLAYHIHCEKCNSISPFLCHKLLMIMMRLCECSGARLLLALVCCSSLHSFGRSLLGFTLLDSCTTSADGPLADSPFFSSMARKSRLGSLTPSVRHLQRRSLYTLFKIASSLHQFPNLRTVTSPQDNGGSPAGLLKKICTLEQMVNEMLVDWLDRQVQSGAARGPVLTDSDSTLNPEVRTFLDQLAKSFVELYFDEDDLMLKMLILLTTQPTPLSALTATDNSNQSRRWKLVAMALSPERVFHAFLAAIQFSSSVLLDFLISEDSGALCAMYLMKSIRCVLGSWPELERSVPGSSYLVDGEGDDTSRVGLRIRTPHVGKRKREGAMGEHSSDAQGCGQKVDCVSSSRMSLVGEDSVLRREAYCLLQLKLSIERLHRRSLFPYNPSALLRRLDAVLERLVEYVVAGEPSIIS